MNELVEDTPFIKQVWDDFRSTDIKEYLKQRKVGGDKNQRTLTYLAWSGGWAIVMDKYPESTYSFTEHVYPNNTMEVRCLMNIVKDAQIASREMWLPVMSGFMNAAVENPTSRDISDARMRCMIKTLAIFGLAIELYFGEEIPEEKTWLTWEEKLAKLKAERRRELWNIADVMIAAFYAEEESTAAETWREATEEEKYFLNVAETKGGFFTQAQKRWLGEAMTNTMTLEDATNIEKSYTNTTNIGGTNG